MSKNTRITIRFIVGIFGLVLIVVAIVFMTKNRPEAELPDSIPATYGAGDTVPSPTASGGTSQSPLPSDTDVSATPDLSWEWPVDADGNLIIDPSSNSDIPPDASGGADADTP